LAKRSVPAGGFRPRGYPENGRYEALSNRIGRSDSAMWSNRRSFSRLPDSYYVRATVRSALRTIGTLKVGPACRACGTRLYPHSCSIPALT